MDISETILPTKEYLTMLRESLSRLPITEREASFLNQLSRGGLRVKERDGLYAISCDRSVSPPSVQWRRLANTTMRMDNEFLPDIIGYGPPEVFYLPSGDMKKILDLTSEGHYRVETVVFGTVCWLYWYEDEWRISTKGLANAGDIQIRTGTPTLQEALDAALEATLKSNVSTDDFWDSLKHDVTYGLLLHHRKMHIFTYGKVERKVWHISSTNNTTGEILRGDRIGLPYPPVLIQKPNEENIDTLCKRCSMSLKDEDLATLGFILRSTNIGETPEYPSVVVKSPLYMFIESQIGKLVPLRTIVTGILYSSPEEKSLFRKVFQDLVPLLDMAEKQLDVITDSIMQHHAYTYHQGPQLVSDAKIIGIYDEVYQKLGRNGFVEGEVRKYLLNAKSPISTTVKSLLYSLLPTEVPERRS